MAHSSTVSGRVVFLKHRTRLAAMMIIMLTGLFFTANTNAVGQPMNMISAVQAESSGVMNTITIQTKSDPAYTVYELFNPSRIIVDIANTSPADENSVKLPSSIPIRLNSTTVSDTDPSLTRLEFTFDNDYTTYDVKTMNNAIILTVTMDEDGSTMAGQESSPGQIDSLIAEKQNIESQLPAATLAGTGSSGPAGSAGAKSAGDSMRSSFTFGGYDKTRISVDFYKIDLHNVFRLIREVSDLNLVVDEAVKGSLTLALNDVPWDFALDIILNLKDLHKEERFNTIVILPGKKEFAWPERAEDNLNFEADENLAVQEAIVIQQQLNLPPEVIEAKKDIQKGREAEKKGHYQDAITAYADAFAKWPDNERLANKISSIYLVYLRQNARAVHYAKQALAINPNNDRAALNAAIALANMQEQGEAQQYFDQAVSVSKPSKEALLSYAVFSEEQGQYQGAVKLLDKYEMLYGANLDSMIAYARLLDKQGSRDAATEKYKSILLSGYQIPPDLKNYINSRIALNQ
ncbi:MAG: AMIN domain-containing protein [Desulfobulbaceae bacterium]|nr:AMIN domain-containing protein [Desulfobulbaceae bacterium]